jgi:hypothetical protein
MERVPDVEEIRNVQKMVVRKPKGNRPFGGLRCSWEDNIKTVFKKIWCEGVDWIHTAPGEGPVSGSIKSLD